MRVPASARGGRSVRLTFAMSRGAHRPTGADGSIAVLASRLFRRNLRHGDLARNDGVHLPK